MERENKVEKLRDKRILYKTYYSTIVEEGVIEEISSNSKYVKINDKWYKIDDIRVLDVLEEEKIGQLLELGFDLIVFLIFIILLGAIILILSPSLKSLFIFLLSKLS